MSKKYILGIDQGTTGSRAVIYDSAGRIVGKAYREFKQYYPQPGWVEHDANEILSSVHGVVQKALSEARISQSLIVGIGITNQRETVVVWNKQTGKPIHRAIVWQDRRTASFCDKHKNKHEQFIRNRTGLVLDPYFSATKISWILDHVNGARSLAARDQLCAGTIDTWLLWNLSGRKYHATDYTNASRTLLFNIKTLKWDRDLLNFFRVPESILPNAQPSGSLFGTTLKQTKLRDGIPVYSMVGDQQAALFGQGCVNAGEAKNTYGTGAFIMMNIGARYRAAENGILTTLACDRQGAVAYAYEGAVFVSGAAIQWLRDGLKIIKEAKETEEIAKRVKDSGGVTMIPAFTGLGAPYWNANAKGMISGITRGTTYEHIVRAALESVAHQSTDVIEVMKKSSHLRLRELKVDGGVTRNHFLMQFQADLIQAPVFALTDSEATVWGASKLAGIQAGVYKQDHKPSKYYKFFPKMKPSKARAARAIWKKEINRLLSV